MPLSETTVVSVSTGSAAVTRTERQTLAAEQGRRVVLAFDPDAAGHTRLADLGHRSLDRKSALEALDRVGILDQIGVDRLDRHEALQLPVMSQVNEAETALTEDSLDPVAPVEQLSEVSLAQPPVDA